VLYHGFLRVAAAVPRLRVADCDYNRERILTLLAHAAQEQAAVAVFPELCLTGYTCGDLFLQPTLQRAACDSLLTLAQRSREIFAGLVIVGLPLAVAGQLYNCAAVIHQGRLLGLVPKSFLPNYKEFYEARWFAPAATAAPQGLRLGDQEVRFGADQLFQAEDAPALTLGVEICEDLWVPLPPSSWQALRGATLLVNLSASNEVIGKAAYRRQLVLSQSGRCVAAYVYVSSGVWESTTDVVFGGHCLIAENGVLLAESDRFCREETLLVADVDLERLEAERRQWQSFGAAQRALEPGCSFVRRCFRLGGTARPRPLRRPVEAHPFVPAGAERLRERCEEIFQTQVAGLAKRLEHLGRPVVTLGVSGGLDSTLALLVACKTFDLLGEPRSRIHALTLPGFGTSTRTRQNALALMRHLGVNGREIDIRALCLEQMRALGHRPFGLSLEGLDVEQLTAALQALPPDRRQDLVFENLQARMRTSLLMNSGFVIGTGDLSELALGWCTYNADHMSMYNPNASIPKTLVKFLVSWAADHEFAGEVRQLLHDIVATEISPELLPTDAAGHATQATEQVIGPYELHDFFLYHFLRYGAPPEKILYLAEHARFDRPYSRQELRHWLRVFVQRFFANQFKRSCLPDGPKVGTVSLSPRGDWRMPSDAEAQLWLAWAQEQETTSSEAAAGTRTPPPSPVSPGKR
jgi:NAD+ synthase (glutamine-hydrolysing)